MIDNTKMRRLYTFYIIVLTILFIASMYNVILLHAMSEFFPFIFPVLIGIVGIRMDIVYPSKMRQFYFNEAETLYKSGHTTIPLEISVDSESREIHVLFDNRIITTFISKAQFEASIGSWVTYTITNPDFINIKK